MHNPIIGILCKEGRVKADKNISERKVFVWTSGILHITHMHYNHVIVVHKKNKNYKKWKLQLRSSSILHTTRMYYFRVIVDHKKNENYKICCLLPLNYCTIVGKRRSRDWGIGIGQVIFLEQYCNHGIHKTTRITEPGASIENSLQNIYLVGKNQKSKIKIVITQQKNHKTTF